MFSPIIIPKRMLLLAMFLGISFLLPAQDAALNQMYTAVRNANKVSFKFRSFERMDKGSSSDLTEKYMTVNMTHRPMDVEINMIKPNKGTKVLYNSQKKASYAKVYINLGIGSVPKDFFIHGSTIMADTHHPITSTGFQPIVNLMKAAQKKSKAEGRYAEVFKDRGVVTFDGRQCRKIEVFDDKYAFVEYTAKEGETVLSIARKNNINAYKIMKLNPSISKSHNKIGGKTINIPSSYAKYTCLYIDTQNSLPYMTEVHDDKGLFEKYYFLDVKM